MIDQYNTNKTIETQAKVIERAIQRMEAVRITRCPDDYREAWDNLINLWRNWRYALEAGEIVRGNKLASQHNELCDRLNEIAREHGVQIKR